MRFSFYGLTLVVSLALLAIPRPGAAMAWRPSLTANPAAAMSALSFVETQSSGLQALVAESVSQSIGIDGAGSLPILEISSQSMGNSEDDESNDVKWDGTPTSSIIEIVSGVPGFDLKSL